MSCRPRRKNKVINNNACVTKSMFCGLSNKNITGLKIYFYLKTFSFNRKRFQPIFVYRQPHKFIITIAEPIVVNLFLRVGKPFFC